MQARRGELVDVLGGAAGLVAEVDEKPAGLATWLATSLTGETTERAEVRAVAVASAARRRGIARALLESAHGTLRAAGVTAVWLTTTNDNLGALALYEGLGYRVVEVRHGAVDEARRTIKPSIGLLGEHGIPISDELELELRL